MKIFLISPVKWVDVMEEEEILKYVQILEDGGHEVHRPIRDTGSQFEICTQNAIVIRDADEVHVWWDSGSSGSKFDLGVAFALGKKIVVANGVAVRTTEGFCSLLRDMEEAL